MHFIVLWLFLSFHCFSSFFFIKWIVYDKNLSLPRKFTTKHITHFALCRFCNGLDKKWNADPLTLTCYLLSVCVIQLNWENREKKIKIKQKIWILIIQQSFWAWAQALCVTKGRGKSRKKNAKLFKFNIKTSKEVAV